MFREKLHNDLDGISPDDELLSKISLMMAEEAEKPKQPIYINIAKWGGMAAAICLIAVGAVTFLGKGSDGQEIATADASDYLMETAYSDDIITEPKDKSKSDKYLPHDTVDAVTQESDTGASAEESTFKYFNFDIDTSTIQLNENPDLSKKAVPEGYAAVDYIVPEEISDLVDKNTDIVIVKIAGDDEYTSSSFTGEAALYSAQAEAIVESELFLAGDIIPVFVPYSKIEASLEYDKYYLLVITEYESGIFKIYSGKESVFEINNDNTVTSQSPFKVPSMLDGLTVEEAASVLKYEQELKNQ